MDNRSSSLFALVRGCRDSSGLGRFALACCAMLILYCTVANAQTATGQFNGHVYDQSGAAVAGTNAKGEKPETARNQNGRHNRVAHPLPSPFLPGKSQNTLPPLSAPPARL